MRTAPITAVEKINEHGLEKEEMPIEEMEHRPQNSVAIVGILVTILIFLLVQTAGIAYWAGGQSSKQDTTQSQLNELKNRFDIISGQFQLVTNKLAALEAAANAENRGKK